MLHLEPLEDRTVPSAYIVTTTADGGAGSLRDAITQINADTNHTLYASPSNSSVDEIDFNVTAASDVAGGGSGYNSTTGVATITPQTSLPSITNAVLIDGYTQAGASGNTNPFGQADNAVLKVELNGSAVVNAYGLVVSAANSTVRGLVINRCAGTGIEVVQTGSGNDWIYGNFIGVDPTGMVNEGNATGVYVVSATNVTIGSKNDGHDALERNLISGHAGNFGNQGIFVRDNSTAVTIQGNYLGTDATGSAQFNFVTNGDEDIMVTNSSNLYIIGNVVSGPADMGMYLSADSNVTIQTNRIGTTADGTQALGGSAGTAAGIWMEGGCTNIVIGGVDTNTPGAALAGAGNLISGNYNGLEILDTANSTIQGNYIGTDLTGSHAIPNVNHGIVVGHAGTQNLTIGGVAAGAGNLVSGNALAGISIAGTAGPVLIEGNTIGTDATGHSAIGNNYGVGISAASGVTVGGTDPAARNVISGNTGDGVLINSGTGNSILGNSIHDNGGLGIDLGNGANDNQAVPVLTSVVGTATSPTIGGTLTSVANTTFRIEFFANPLPSNLANTEGQTLLGSVYVTTNATGNASFTASGLAPIPATQGYLTATATVATATNNGYNYGDTSPFSSFLHVTYFFGGFQAPLSQGLNFALNRVILIKFTLTDLTGAAVTSLAAVSSLQVAPVNNNGSLGTPFTPASPGNTTLSVSNSTYIFNWQTKGLTAGSYEILLTLADGTVLTKVIQLTKSGNSSGLTTVAAGGTGTAPGGLLGGDIDLYVDNTNGDLTADELARIQDAVTAANAVTAPYGVAVVEVTDPTLADVTLNMDTTSAVGGYAAGVLGCTTDAGQITIINGWNFYAGSDATQIGSAQYDFETVVEHELGHALGLGHSTDSTSVMYSTLNTGAVDRTLTTADLNVPDSDTTGACGLHAATIPLPATPVSSNPPAPIVPGRDAFFAMLLNSATASALAPNAAFPNPAHDAVFADPTADSGAMLPSANLAALNTTPIFGAAGWLQTDVYPFAATPGFSDAVQEGLGDPPAASAPAHGPPSADFDFIPADGALVMES
jgi:hypothetical protein